MERTIASIPRVEENYRSKKIYPKYFNFENSKDICITKLSYGAISNYIKKVKILPDDQYIFQVVKIKMIGEPPSQISLFDSELIHKHQSAPYQLMLAWKFQCLVSL